MRMCGTRRGTSQAQVKASFSADCGVWSHRAAGAPLTSRRGIEYSGGMAAWHIADTNIFPALSLKQRTKCQI